MKNNLSVYVADDHNIVRSGMMRLLSTFKRVAHVDEASDGKRLLQLIKERQPDAVILDIEMPGMNGLDTAHHIIEHFPQSKILILTMHTEESFIVRLMDMGVHGFLSKSAEPEELEEALYNIIDKDFYKNELVIMALKKIKKPLSDPSRERLSNRELEILALICQEYSPGEISDRLQISEKTFFNHRTNIITKTGAKNNIGLYKYALQHGYSKE